jgi:four helix bundle protein
MKANDVEELKIYKRYVELIDYTEMITEKYPKKEKFAIVSTIKNTTYSGMQNIISAYKLYSKTDKLNNLNQLDINLKMLKVLIRVSYKQKYINSNNYGAWSGKLFNIGNLLGGWINSCLKQ